MAGFDPVGELVASELFERRVVLLANSNIMASKRSSKKKNKLGVKNSLVNNINARKKKGISRSKKKRSVSRKSYRKMKSGWGRKKKSGDKS